MTSTVPISTGSAPSDDDAADVSPRSTDRVRRHGRDPLSQLWILTGRSVREVLADKRIAVFGLLQPLILLLLVSQVFGSLVDSAHFPDGVGYVDFLVPALLITTAVGTAPGSGIALVQDMNNGMVTRFRSLPVRMGLVVAARSLADLGRTAFELLALLVCAVLLFGFSPAGGFLGLVGAFLVTQFVSWALIWCYLAMGARLGSVQLIQSIGFLIMTPLMFASSAFAPTDALPPWLRFVTAINPITYAIDAARALALGAPAGTTVLAALGSSLLIIVVAMALAVQGINRPQSPRGDR